MPDLESYITDYMSRSWENTYIYAFPLFSINKIKKEAEKALIIVAMWPTQTWFIWVLELAKITSIIIESRHLHLPGTSKQHPLCPKLKLMAMMAIYKPSLQPGHHRLNSSTNQYLKNGRNFSWRKEHQYHADR